VGLYPLGDGFAIPEGVRVIGANPERTTLRTPQASSSSGTYYGMGLSSGSGLKECHVVFGVGVETTSRGVLVYIPDGTGVRVERNWLDGLVGGVELPIETVGIEIHGGTVSDSVIAENRFSGLFVGVETVDSGVKVARNRFTELGGEGITVRGSAGRDSGAAVPVLGDSSLLEDTGVNVFRDVEGYAVRNETGELVKA